MGYLVPLPMALVVTILALSALAEAETQAINSLSKNTVRGEASISSSDITKNEIHRQLASNPYSCTVKELNGLQKRALRKVKGFETILKKIRKTAGSKCRSKLKIGLKKFSPLRSSLNSYKYLAGEMKLKEILAGLKFCSSEKLYSSAIGTYNSGLILGYASASCYYYLYPVASPAPAPAPAPVSK